METRGISGFRLRLNVAHEVEKERNGCSVLAIPSDAERATKALAIANRLTTFQDGA